MANLSDRLTGTEEAILPNENMVINGGADIWQRGLSFDVSGARAYSADRWFTQDDVDRSNDVPDSNAAYSLDIVGPYSVFGPSILTTVELSNPSNGSAPFTPSLDYTLSFWAKREVSQPYNIEVSFVDEAGSLAFKVPIISVNTESATAGEWQKFTVTFNIGNAVPNASNQALQIKFIASNFATFEHMFLTLVKLEQGSVATEFTRAGNTLAGELAMCQRYFQSMFQGQGKTLTTTLARCYGVFPVQMRVKPFVSLFDDEFIQISIIGITDRTVGSIGSHTGSTYSAQIDFNLTSTGPINEMCAVNHLYPFLSLDAEI